MLFFKKKEDLPMNTFEDERKYVIEWLRKLDVKSYDKVIRVVDTYREADEKVKVIELGSKKAVREAEKEVIEEKELEKVLDEQIIKEFME